MHLHIQKPFHLPQNFNDFSAFLDRLSDVFSYMKYLDFWFIYND